MTPPIAAIALHTSIGPVWTVLGALVLIVLAIWSYRWTRPPIPVWGRVSLAILRALALIAVWLLATGSELRWVNEVEVKPRVAMLLDASESMAFTDASGQRSDSVRAVLESPLWSQLGQYLDLEPAMFSSTLEDWNGRDLPELDGAVTDIEAALTEYARKAEDLPDAMILISDGAFNRGGAYTAAARRLNMPIHAIAIGDSLPTRDVVISSLLAPELGYAGESFPLDITLRATGADGETARVRVIGEDGQILSTRDITVEGTWSEQTITVELTPQTAGVNSWMVEVLPLSDEVDADNNSRRAVIHAAERRRTVLVFAPAPHPDAGAFARSLEEDPDTDAIIVIGGGRLTNPVRGMWEDIEPGDLDAALVRDCLVKVTWTGDADVDLLVEEPSGTVCSLRDPRTTGGGVMLGDAASRDGQSSADGVSETYVCPEAFDGTYRVLLRRVWGKVTAGKVTVDVYHHYGSEDAMHLRHQIPLGETDQLVVFDLANGRRQDALDDQLLANAAAEQMHVNQAILAQQLGGLANSGGGAANLNASRLGLWSAAGAASGRLSAGHHDIACRYAFESHRRRVRRSTVCAYFAAAAFYRN